MQGIQVRGFLSASPIQVPHGPRVSFLSLSSELLHFDLRAFYQEEKKDAAVTGDRARFIFCVCVSDGRCLSFVVL